MAQGVYRTSPKMAMSIPGTRTSSGWSEYHSTFMRMSADRCVDRERLRALAVRITDIDAFHRVGQGECNLLFHASMDKNTVALEVLLNHGADPTKRNKSGVGLLNMFMKRGQTEMAKKCVDHMKSHRKQGQLTNFFKTPFDSGWTPLMTAAENGRADSVRWLIAQGVHVNEAMSTGWTAAHAAAKRGHPDIVRLLEEFGADKNAKAQHKDFGSEPVTYQDILRRKYPDAPSASVKEPVEKVQEDEKKNCVVCMERSSKTVMVPCGHASFCEECAKRLQSTTGRCAICRAKIQTVMNIYFS